MYVVFCWKCHYIKKKQLIIIYSFHSIDKKMSAYTLTCFKRKWENIYLWQSVYLWISLEYGAQDCLTKKMALKMYFSFVLSQILCNNKNETWQMVYKIADNFFSKSFLHRECSLSLCDKEHSRCEKGNKEIICFF